MVWAKTSLSRSLRFEPESDSEEDAGFEEEGNPPGNKAGEPVTRPRIRRLLNRNAMYLTAKYRSVLDT